MPYVKTPKGAVNGNVVHFMPKRELCAEQNRIEFIRICRDELTVFGSDLYWESFRWLRICQFTKLGTPRQLNHEKGMQRQLDSAIVDLAKAYVRYEAGIQGFTVHRAQQSVRAFRVLEKALLNVSGTANPEGIDLVILDRSAQLIREYFNKETAYHAGQTLAVVAKFLSEKNLISTNLSYWKNPIRSVDNLNARIGKEAERARLKKMPDPRALDALAEIFAHDLNPSNPGHHKDIYTTSVSAMLLAAPSRGQEIHVLPVDLEIERPDSSTGAMQYGFRYFAGKGYGADIKWVPEIMVPVAKQAVRRLAEITAEARKLARYIELQVEARKRDPNAPMPFYRHRNCPNVDDSQALTGEQVAQALGYASKRSLSWSGLSSTAGTYTLNSLWQWVIANQPEGFPWLNKEKDIKYSEALFCMTERQLRTGSRASPVILWAPTLPIYNADVNKVKDQRSVFERYGYMDESGKPLKINSHQCRHYLNTLAQRGNMTPEEIAKWSGRANQKQNRVYNHETEFERADRAKKALDLCDREQTGQPTLEKPKRDSEEAIPHWDVTLKPKPISCADLDLVPRGANHITLWGTCEHDFLFSPCEKFGLCLNCSEHHCIKSAGTNDQERLARIKSTLHEVEKEYESAKAAHEAGFPGSENWHHFQKQYLERLGQLIAILEDSTVPEGAIVRLNGGSQTHLHRVLRTTALSALENKTSPANVIEDMLNVLGGGPSVPGSMSLGTLE